MDVFAHLYFDHYECINIISYNAIKSISYSIWCCGITTPPDPCKQSLTACVIPSDFLFTIRNTREIIAIQVWSHAPPTEGYCFYKNFLLVLCMACYAPWNGLSGTTFYDSYLIMMWLSRSWVIKMSDTRLHGSSRFVCSQRFQGLRKLCKFTSWLVKALGLVAIRKYSKQKFGHRSRSLRHWWYFIVISIWWRQNFEQKMQAALTSWKTMFTMARGRMICLVLV